MAIEIRRLIINDDELQQICSDYMASGESGAVTGTLMNMEIVKDEPLEVSLNVHSTEGQQIPFTMDEGHLVASMLCFCASKKIPVSRSATKSVKKSDNGMIIFDMVLQSSV